MLADKVAGKRLGRGFIQRFAAERSAQPQPVNQCGEPVARLFSLFTRQLAAELVHQFESNRRLLTCCKR